MEAGALTAVRLMKKSSLTSFSTTTQNQVGRIGKDRSDRAYRTLAVSRLRHPTLQWIIENRLGQFDVVLKKLKG